jgi:hypothetical protein
MQAASGVMGHMIPTAVLIVRGSSTGGARPGSEGTLLKTYSCQVYPVRDERTHCQFRRFRDRYDSLKVIDFYRNMAIPQCMTNTENRSRIVIRQCDDHNGLGFTSHHKNAAAVVVQHCAIRKPARFVKIDTDLCSYLTHRS